MSIKFKLILIGFLSSAIVLFVGVSLFFITKIGHDHEEKVYFTDELIFALFERNLFFNDYLFVQNERAKHQLLLRNEDIDKLLIEAQNIFTDEFDLSMLEQIEDSQNNVVIPNIEFLFENIDSPMESYEHRVGLVLQESQSAVNMAKRLGENDKAKLEGFNNFANIFLGSFAIIGFFLLFWIIASVIYLIKQIQESTEQITRGNFEHRIKTSSKDEMGQLAFSFNAMAQKLQQSHSDLEQRIKDRTKQLTREKARHDAILENIGDGLIFTGLDKKILLTNIATQKMLGFEDFELLGRRWDDVMKVKNESGKNLSYDELPINKILTSKKNITINSDFCYYTKKDGTVFPAAVTVSKMMIEGEFQGVIITFRDITEQKRIDRAKTEFVSLASHQLKTPPTAISWITERLLSGKAGKLTKKQEEYFTDIRKSNQRMIEMVNALLNVSRIELGSFAISLAKKNACTIVNDVVKELKPICKKQKLVIQEKYPKVCKEMMIDEVVFEMIIYNIVSNSIQYTAEGGKISIECKFVKKEAKIGGKTMKRNSFVIIISDTGCGIPEEQQDKLFAKFFRADNAQAKYTGGTGLGLYIVKSILDNSGGLIWFESVEKKGSTFYIAMSEKGMKQKKKGGALIR
ncbi:MAG: ATP-binding protein [Patescibacteria group bacterium]